MSELKASRVGSTRIVPLYDEIRFMCGPEEKPLRFLKFSQMRQFADALHDLADELEAEGRRETERTTK